jgi:hypothetical protein
VTLNAIKAGDKAFENSRHRLKMREPPTATFMLCYDQHGRERLFSDEHVECRPAGPNALADRAPELPLFVVLLVDTNYLGRRQKASERRVDNNYARVIQRTGVSSTTMRRRLLMFGSTFQT